jgi:hypothetical protein
MTSASWGVVYSQLSYLLGTVAERIVQSRWYMKWLNGFFCFYLFLLKSGYSVLELLVPHKIMKEKIKEAEAICTLFVFAYDFMSLRFVCLILKIGELVSLRRNVPMHWCTTFLSAPSGLWLGPSPLLGPWAGLVGP